MMRRVSACLFFVLCYPMVYAGYSDGLISTGEYEWDVEWTSGLLIVNGGGADLMEILNSACLEVRSTSIPLGSGVGGIMDIAIKNNSHLDYYGGITQELTVRGNATANIYGGRIDYISSAQYTIKTGDEPHINLYCQPGWSWILNSSQKKIGISGLWKDNSAFSIHFTNNFDDLGADPVWTNINVIPEPATMLLFGLGGLLLCRKK